jgi:hypothetical protein
MSTVYPQVGGYPQYPQYTPPAYRLYDMGAVFLAAFLGSPLAGTVLVASNYRKLGQGGNGVLALILGAAASAGLILMGLKTAMSPTVASIVLFVCTGLAARELQGNAISTHVAWGGQLYSKWRAVGVALLTTLVLGLAAAGYLYYTGQLQNIIAQFQTPTHVLTIGTKDQIVYSGTATQNDATALGNALKTAGYFQDTGVTVLLNKTASSTTISFVVQDGAWNNAADVSAFETIVRGVASSVGGLPIDMRLVNTALVVEKDETIQ